MYIREAEMSFRFMSIDVGEEIDTGTSLDVGNYVADKTKTSIYWTYMYSDLKVLTDPRLSYHNLQTTLSVYRTKTCIIF